MITNTCNQCGAEMDESVEKISEKKEINTLACPNCGDKKTEEKRS